MLRIAEHFYATDVGRMRQGNEDNFFARPPLFAVCDGMGGAQAGEVASEIAAKSFEEGLPEGQPPELGLAEIIERANARIHARSRTEAGRAGMGCTCTAVYVDVDEVALAHVGDSRAYRLRDGEFVQMTRDHSLVGEFVAAGKMTEEEAEKHPQRSIITRALGPEPQVEVDTATHGGKAGDIYLLCSDGLTSMVPTRNVKPIIDEGGSLEDIGKRLIDAANAAGGRDNITVILLRLEEAKARAAGGGDGEDTSATAELDTAAYEEYDESELADPEPRQGITKAEWEAAHAAERQAQPADARKAEAQEWEQNRPATVALGAIRPGMSIEEALAQPPANPAGLPTQPPPEAPSGPPATRTPPPSTPSRPLPDSGPPATRTPPPSTPSRPLPPAHEVPRRTMALPDEERPKGRRRRRIVFLIAFLVVLAIILTGAFIATRAVYFIGTDTANANAITIYRGLPYELPGGVKLYESYAVSGVTLGQVPARRRATFTNHSLRTRDDAEDLVNQLELGKLE